MGESLTFELSVQIAGLTNLGGRQSNEDAYRHASSGRLDCFVVSDGVGGEEGGEVASALIVDTVAACFGREPSADEGALLGYLDAAMEAVRRGQEENRQLHTMSATVALMVLDSGAARVRWTHLGDSRVYQFRQRRLFRMTRDHSAVQQLIDAGYCTPGQLRSHPLRGSLLAAVGLSGETPITPIEEEGDVRSGDAFLICSDGFWEWITEVQMAAVLAQSESVDQWLAGMEAVTRQNCLSSPKPRDNYTAFAVWVGEQR